MTVLRIGEVYKAEVALNQLYQVVPRSPAEAVDPVIQGSKKMIDNKKQGQRTGGRRNANPPDAFREGVLKLQCEDSKLMLVTQFPEDPEVAAPDRIRRNNFVVNNENLAHELGPPDIARFVAHAPIDCSALGDQLLIFVCT